MQSFNAPNTPMTLQYHKIPLLYCLQYKCKTDSHLVVMEITKNVVSYTFRSNTTNKIGIIRRTKLLYHNKRPCFLVSGKRVYLGGSARVI